MKHAVLLLAFALPLAACNKGAQVEATNATPGEVAKKLEKAGGSDAFVKPGRWESKFTIDEMSMPGMPAGAAAQMKSATGQIQTHVSCLTADQVKRPKEDFFAGANKNCRYDHFEMGNGKIDAQMTCEAAEKGNAVMKMTMAGTYAPDSYHMTMGMTSNAGDALDQGMTMKMHVDANRVGECTGKENSAAR